VLEEKWLLCLIDFCVKYYYTLQYNITLDNKVLIVFSPSTMDTLFTKENVKE